MAASQDGNGRRAISIPDNRVANGFLDLFVCNYVRWSAQHDVFCSSDGKQKAYCTPEAYRGETCWLFRNRGNGRFEEAGLAAGIAVATDGQQVEVAVIEVGLGGRYDSTNVITPLAGAITSIGLDHQQHLGDLARLEGEAADADPDPGAIDLPTEPGDHRQQQQADGERHPNEHSNAVGRGLAPLSVGPAYPLLPVSVGSASLTEP